MTLRKFEDNTGKEIYIDLDKACVLMAENEGYTRVIFPATTYIPVKMGCEFIIKGDINEIYEKYLSSCRRDCRIETRLEQRKPVIDCQMVQDGTKNSKGQMSCGLLCGIPNLRCPGIVKEFVTVPCQPANCPSVTCMVGINESTLHCQRNMFVDDSSTV